MGVKMKYLKLFEAIYYTDEVKTSTGKKRRITPLAAKKLAKMDYKLGDYVEYTDLFKLYGKIIAVNPDSVNKIFNYKVFFINPPLGIETERWSSSRQLSLIDEEKFQEKLIDTIAHKPDVLKNDEFIAHFKKLIPDYLNRSSKIGLLDLKENISRTLSHFYPEENIIDFIENISKITNTLINDEIKKLENQEPQYAYWWIFKDDPKHPVAILLHSVMNLYGDNYSNNFYNLHLKTIKLFFTPSSIKKNDDWYKNPRLGSQIIDTIKTKIDEMFLNVATEKMTKLIEEYPESYKTYYELASKHGLEWLFDNTPDWIKRGYSSGLLDIKTKYIR